MTPDARRIAPETLPQPEQYRALADRRPLWVFGYGSLMWNPGFDSEVAEPAHLFGYHRRFCIYSHHYRGTPERPGLVLGLDRGGSCRGIAYRIAPANAPDVLDYLWSREMISAVYCPTVAKVRVAHQRVEALTFVANPAHDQYHTSRCCHSAAELIRSGYGSRGANRDYLVNTLGHLADIGITDGGLRHLLHLLDAAAGSSAQTQG